LSDATPVPRAAAYTAAATIAALVAFAANSVLCRLALGDRAIDAAGFTAVRILAGAVTLFVLAQRRGGARTIGKYGSWRAACALFGYAIAFSFAYLSLSAGTGALLLFGAVQLTMIAAAVREGARPRPLEWLGLAGASAGLVVLVAPGVVAPPPLGAALMLFAGVCWGMYSLLGRGSAVALLDTAANFVRAAPLALVTSALLFARAHASLEGVLAAIASGAIASGLGYVSWYAALRGLTATRAAIVQLTVPLIAAVGGVIFLGETVSLRLLEAALLILGGIGLAIAARAPAAAGTDDDARTTASGR
jgi:drug/metabolite transporter (DMT)-like permease